MLVEGREGERRGWKECEEGRWFAGRKLPSSLSRTEGLLYEVALETEVEVEESKREAVEEREARFMRFLARRGGEMVGREVKFLRWVTGWMQSEEWEEELVVA
jgi:hypothetical protein